jgi:hypothetical protein
MPAATVRRTASALMLRWPPPIMESTLPAASMCQGTLKHHLGKRPCRTLARLAGYREAGLQTLGAGALKSCSWGSTSSCPTFVRCDPSMSQQRRNYRPFGTDGTDLTRRRRQGAPLALPVSVRWRPVASVGTYLRRACQRGSFGFVLAGHTPKRADNSRLCRLRSKPAALFGLRPEILILCHDRPIS